MDNNINFTGSFLISKQTPKKMHKIFNEMLPDSRFMKQNLFNQTNSFVSTNRRYDREVADYLMDRNIIFSYFPNIDLKSGVCNMSKKELEALIKSEKALVKQKEIAAHVKDVENSVIPLDYVWKDGDHMAQTISALKTVEHIAVDKLTPITVKNVTLFIDREGRVAVEASPNNARGINFIRIFDRYADEDMEMMKVNYKGEICYRTSNIDKLKIFKRDFMAAVNTDRKRPRANNG